MDSLQVPGVAFALNLGCDALVIPNTIKTTKQDNTLLWETVSVACLQRKELTQEAVPADEPEEDSAQLSIGRGIVTEVVAGGRGDRVALDCIRLMRLGEAASSHCGSSLTLTLSLTLGSLSSLTLILIR